MDLPWQPASRSSATFSAGFWKSWVQLIGAVTLRHEYTQMEHQGQVDALDLDPLTHRGRKAEDDWYWGGSIFWDSDVGKWLEAASAWLEREKDPELERLVDGLIARLGRAQRSDGYLNSHISTWRPHHRFKNLRDLHELYCAGHLIEAGVVHFEATRKDSLLNIVCRYADYLVQRFGPKNGQIPGYCGHPEIELALVRLARVTGNSAYLQLCRYFIEQRGRAPLYFEEEAVKRLDARPFRPKHPGSPLAYMQASRPIREHDKIEGHAVRAMYLYSAVADLAALDRDEGLLQVCRRIWEDACSTKLYLTGGLGSAAENEGFTADYDLPNEHAYAETCASIALFLFGHRLQQLDLDSRYGDVMEAALYNNILSGIGLDGKSFFYENPLASRGAHHRLRWPWWCPCCPPNIARFLLSLTGYLFSTRGDTLAIHFLAASESSIELAGGTVGIAIKTGLPFAGNAEILVTPPSPREFSLAIRQPVWAQDWKILVNGAAQPGTPAKGYHFLRRRWVHGDLIRLEFDLPVRRHYARYEVDADRGRVALSRGPLIYCLEATDNGPRLDEILIPPRSGVSLQPEVAGLPGIVGLTIDAERESDSSGTELYAESPPARTQVPVQAVPYYAWDNRAPGEMQVWLRRG